VKELDLLEPMQAPDFMGPASACRWAGFWAVNRAKVKALPGDKLASWRAPTSSSFLYTHCSPCATSIC